MLSFMVMLSSMGSVDAPNWQDFYIVVDEIGQEHLEEVIVEDPLPVFEIPDALEAIPSDAI